MQIVITTHNYQNLFSPSMALRPQSMVSSTESIRHVLTGFIKSHRNDQSPHQVISEQSTMAAHYEEIAGSGWGGLSDAAKWALFYPDLVEWGSEFFPIGYYEIYTCFFLGESRAVIDLFCEEHGDLLNPNFYSNIRAFHMHVRNLIHQMACKKAGFGEAEVAVLHHYIDDPATASFKSMHITSDNRLLLVNSEEASLSIDRGIVNRYIRVLHLMWLECRLEYLVVVGADSKVLGNSAQEIFLGKEWRSFAPWFKESLSNDIAEMDGFAKIFGSIRKGDLAEAIDSVKRVVYYYIVKDDPYFSEEWQYFCKHYKPIDSTQISIDGIDMLLRLLSDMESLGYADAARIRGAIFVPNPKLSTSSRDVKHSFDRAA